MAFPTKLSYIQKFGEEEGNIKWEALSKKKAVTLENLILKYGKELGSQKWEIYCNKHRVKCSLSGFIAKGKTEEDYKKYNASRAVTLKNLTNKYGLEDAILRWESYKKKQSKSGNSLEYFIEVHGEEQGTSRYLEVNSKKAITLENMVRIHGDEQGPIRHAAWQEATKGNYISKLQKNIINRIVEIIPNNYLFHDGIFGKEFCVYSQRAYMYDFVITDPIKICIEINGDYWHANPEFYKPDEFVKLRGGGKFAKDIWEADRQKKFLIEQRGYKMYTIWENDWNVDSHEVLQQVKKWITENE